MNGRLLYTLTVPAAAALLWLNMAAAQVQSPAKPDAKAIQLKLQKEEEAKRLEELKRAELEKALLQLKLQQAQIQLGQPAPNAPVLEVAKAPPAGADQISQARDLAKRIDDLINKKLKSAKVAPAGTAGDTEFFRRLNLDLSGRVPTLLDVRDFLDNQSPEKRAQWIEKLLESDPYSIHFSHVLASAMLGNRLDPGLLGSRELFLRWLQDRIKTNQGYDLTAKELVNQVRKPGEPGMPNGFITFHGNKPEEQTGAVARVLLGIKIECAQCHPHPFASWTKQQFWEFAAFFDPKGLKVTGTGYQRPEIPVPGSPKKAKAKFLDGTEPPDNLPNTPKATLADWIASKDNPYFAKAAADNVWQYFFGASLLEPLLEKEKDKSVITHPELLNLLAKELAAHNFDLKHLVRAIVYTEAYQRTSQGAKNEDQLALFGRMPVRALSADQFYDSFMVATNTKVSEPTLPNNINPNFVQFNPGVTDRGQFLLKFTDTAKATETSTSILQALFLMNNKFINDRIDPKHYTVLSVLASTGGNAKRQIETLYLMSLSRLPSDAELQQFTQYIQTGGATGDRAQALGDLLWALLNSSEFAVNH
ncbi:MAG: hypothetical protein C5B56_08325 [Proteobacteria bacterium]|nr:MAG: hypothetical protein C5B56_08325 [Pseudomonadota bacterium]